MTGETLSVGKVNSFPLFFKWQDYNLWFITAKWRQWYRK